MGFTDYKSKTVLRALKALKFLNTSAFYRNRHLTHNSGAITAYWESHKKDGFYIDDQNAKQMEDILFGRDYGNHFPFYVNKNLFGVDKNGHANHLCAARNACEVIAAYNCLVHRNGGKPMENHSFEQMLFEFEKKGLMLNGNFGVDPGAIYNYMTKMGLKAKMITGDTFKSKKISLDGFSSIILTAFNNAATVTDGIHTISIMKNGADQYFMCNSFITTMHKSFDSYKKAIDAYLEDGKIICIIGIV